MYHVYAPSRQLMNCHKSRNNGETLTRIIHVNQHDNDKVRRQLLTFIVATHSNFSEL